MFHQICDTLYKHNSISAEARSFLGRVWHHGRIALLPAILQRVQEDQASTLSVKAHIADDFVYSDAQRLSLLMSKLLKEKVQVSLEIDPSLQGGMVLFWRDYRLNLSTDRFFQLLRKNIGL